MSARHAKPRSLSSRLGPLAAVTVTLVGAAAAVVLLQGGPADAGASQLTSASRSASSHSGLADSLPIAAIHRASARTQARAAAERARAAARRRKLRAERAARAARAAQQAQQPPTQSSPPPSSGSDAAHSALGICIRNAEEGGSYAWGPGNGGGAYQFLLSTWERYGGAANEYGVAGAAYQDQIFDNAIAAGGASNWTAYDGC
jgi:Transglycosylase-like domain